MENHRPWRRVVSMFRRRRNSSSSSRSSVSSRQARLRQSNESISSQTTPAPMISRLFRDIYRSRYSHQLPSSPHTPQLNNGINWSSLILTSNAFGRSLNKFRDFTPKCLADINCHGLLMGQESYDDFSSSCWLEDHLHHFAEVSEDMAENEDGGNDNDNTSLPSGNENFTLINSSRRLPVSQNSPNLLTGDTFRSNASHGSNSLSVHSSSGPGSRGSTVSDVTHFYNNMNLTGFSFNSPVPPPYTERSDEDLPPPYTDIFVPIHEGRRQSSNPLRASSSLFQDILW